MSASIYVVTEQLVSDLLAKGEPLFVYRSSCLTSSAKWEILLIYR